MPEVGQFSKPIDSHADPESSRTFFLPRIVKVTHVLLLYDYPYPRPL